MGKLITNLRKDKLIQDLARKNSSKDWIKSDTAEMVPDRGFVKQLKRLRETFEVLWNKGSNTWEIWDFPESGHDPYMVTKVQTGGKTYRELGADVLLNLQESAWLTNNFTAKQICDYLEEHNNQITRRKEEEFRNKIMSVAMDTYNYARGVLQIAVPRSLKIERALTNAD